MNTAAPLHERVRSVTERIRVRSADSRGEYLERVERFAAARSASRARLSCTNLAHGFAAMDAPDKEKLRAPRWPNIAIVSSYNDMLSAHRPFERFPELIKLAAREAGAVAQFAGGVPAMCDGVTQGQPGMELSLFSRDVIAMSTAVALDSQHVRQRAVPGHLRQDRARTVDGRARRSAICRRSSCRAARCPPASRTRRRRACASCSPKARSDATRCSNRKRRATTRRAPARSTAPRTAIRC